MERQMNVEFGKIYTVDRMMAKFRRFRSKFKLFENLIATHGMRWDEPSNQVVGSDHDWRSVIAVNKEFRQFRNRNCQYINLLREIFGTRVAATTTTTGQTAQMSTQHIVVSEQNAVRTESSSNRGVEGDIRSSHTGRFENNLSRFEMCIDILQAMENVSSQQFFRAIEQFSHSEKSEMATTLFLRLNDRRRREWLDMLDNS
ncbi:hypothetical protein NMG60_11011719 [Bertholletia excelsa]